MDLASRIEELLVELRQARAVMPARLSASRPPARSSWARDARLGGAHELLRAHHNVEEARRLIEEATSALEIEQKSLSDRPDN